MPAWRRNRWTSAWPVWSACTKRARSTAGGLPRTPVAALEDDPGHDGEALVLWRARLREAEAAEARAWAELAEQPVLARCSPSDLNDFERWELEAELAAGPT
jgi:hypothetical protein